LRILVPIKAVIDYKEKFHVDSCSTNVDTSSSKMTINYYCRLALEEAIKLRKQRLATEVTVLTIGDEKAKDILVDAFALGADSGIFVKAPMGLPSITIAKTIQNIAETECPDMIITGKKSTDCESNQTGQMIAGLLGWSQATFASSIEVLKNGLVNVTREIGDDIEMIELKLPCVITADSGLITPEERVISKMKYAQNHAIKTLDIEDLGINKEVKIKTVRISKPPQKKKCKFLNSSQELVDELKQVAKVLK